ncbi:LysR family transcriptional regulator protein (plasmid) [Rhizobium sp. N541]|uniref:LysR substrate-binding domain-containing protein n=1 Tax=unclassified Rhizobium TaxID=2613769 RepID=UPI0007EE6CDB|nr:MULTISPECIES: LysR substrate-binding domain-containing protein [unclassified Rhizobium]ANM21171.1 LysR family transcriptional regulator protein [Rhizobium sp. N541]ANM27542.1 LysR family transcriptional regulator protein [Rhizobium sp. N941]
MDLSSLEIFLAVAGDRSVTKAAKAVGRVPSNVTTRVRQLEDDLGVFLFSRDGKKMTLTREGETFLAYANRLMALALEARQAVRPLAPSGTLRVGTMESTAASRLPAALTQFNRMWPDVSLHLTMGASRDLARAVVADALDCALIARPPKTMRGEDAGFEAELKALEMEPVFVEDLLIVLPSGHPAVKSAADLRVGSIAALEPGCTYRRIAENWARKSTALPTSEHGSYHAILASVATGNTAGVMPRSVLDLMHWPTSVQTHQLGLVETLLVYRKNDRPSAFNAFHEVLSATKGRDARLAMN